MRSRLCIICGKKFNLLPHSKMQYCSTECQAQGYRRKREARVYDKCPECEERKFHSSKFCQKCFGKTIQGENSPNWKGGRITDKSSGYVLLRTAPSKYRGEHIILWEQSHNKKLPKNWIVHHINGIKDDNRIENLIAMARNNHSNWTLLRIAQKRIRELEQLHLPI